MDSYDMKNSTAEVRTPVNLARIVERGKWEFA